MQRENSGTFYIAQSCRLRLFLSLYVCICVSARSCSFYYFTFYYYFIVILVCIVKYRDRSSTASEHCQAHGAAEEKAGIVQVVENATK